MRALQVQRQELSGIALARPATIDVKDLRGTTMNRNNIFIHLALAIVLILVAAFAGQLNRWRKQWKSHVGSIPAAEKKRRSTAEEIALAKPQLGRPEVLVKFKPGVSRETIERVDRSFQRPSGRPDREDRGWKRLTISITRTLDATRRSTAPCRRLNTLSRTTTSSSTMRSQGRSCRFFRPIRGSMNSGHSRIPASAAGSKAPTSARCTHGSDDRQ